MGRIAVLTGDLVFGRMLELELICAGYEVVFERRTSDGIERTGTLSPNSGGNFEQHRNRGNEGRSDDFAVIGSAENGGIAADVYIVDADTHAFDGIGADASNIVAVLTDPDKTNEFPDAAACLVRPFETAFLLDIISDLTSNANKSSEEPSVTEPSGHIVIDSENSKAYFKGTCLDLTRREFELLACLYSSKGHPVSRSELIRRVWRYDFEGNTNVVDVYIRYLREKIDIPFGVKLIETVRGKGYRIV